MKSYVYPFLISFIKKIYRRICHSPESIKKRIDIAHLQHACIKKTEFIADIKKAINNKKGYAAGKLGNAPPHWLYYEILLKKEKDSQKIINFEKDLIFHGFNQAGIFPAIPSFYLEFNKHYIKYLRNIDCLGICYQPRELKIINYYQLKNKFIHYLYQEPDRSSPSIEENCYLQYFRDKKVLIICPFAELLKERATKDIFEGVWSKTEKKWFYPRKVEALELPWGFSIETHNKYSTALDLFEYLICEIDKKDFEIALIGAAGLAIPIASYIKTTGKLAIDLGGHLQVLFGVIGKRWRNREDWERDYFNEYWIDMPEKYKPKEVSAGMKVCDDGDYW